MLVHNVKFHLLGMFQTELNRMEMVQEAMEWNWYKLWNGIGADYGMELVQAVEWNGNGAVQVAKSWSTTRRKLSLA